MNRSLLLVLAAAIGLSATLFAADAAEAQGDAAGPVIDWSIEDGVTGVDLPFVVTGRVIGDHGLKRLDVEVGLGLETRKFTATGGRFAIVIHGEPTGSRGRFALEVTATDYSDNVAVRTADVVGRRPWIRVDSLEPIELEYPLELTGTASSGFRDGDVDVIASVNGLTVDPDYRVGGAEYGSVQRFSYAFDPRLTKGWVWQPGDVLDVTLRIVDTANRRVERLLQLPLPAVTQYCNGYGVTTSLADGDWPTGGRDIIVGTPGPDLIYGLGGPDVICGLGGDDVIVAGEGNDFVNAGRGNDLVFGEAGNDRLEGKLGNDTLVGGEGDDSLHGNSGTDTLRGQEGTDTANGGINRDACEAETKTSCETVAA